MTTEAQALTSEEDKFFGVRTPVVKGDGTADDGDSGDNINVEVVETLPPEQTPKAPEDTKSLSGEGGEDDELTSYSEGVQKRIKKLTYQREEAKRQMEEAKLLREEAIKAAKHFSDQNRTYEQQLAVGEAQLVDRTKAAATYAVNEAKSALTKAHETGDTEGLVTAQEALNVATNELERANNYEQEFTYRRQQQDHYRQQRAQQPPQQQQPRQATPPPPPDEKASAWAQNNPWFGSDEHKDMTALAYGVHEQLVKNEGINPNTEEYYTRIDDTMRTRFPEYFQGGSQSDGDGSGRQPVSPPPRPTQVVAPSSRNNGAKPRTVKLTSTAVALAKRLGITPEQYAKQLAKEMS